MADSIVFIGLGSNLDRPFFQLRKALNYLANHSAVTLQAYSGVYETQPIGYDSQPLFLNAVAGLSTRYSPLRLLDLLQSVELRQHRKRKSNRNAPRTLDLDILLYRQTRCVTDRLTLPHPRMHLRRFVLQPLLEISPSQVIPGKGPATRYLSSVSDQACRRISPILLI